ncbi:MAG TPA: GNAT family N-acetyltransferase [Fimbriimonas sp.]|nr:GNAT family N-acetyltransferase [Fimbriimonas sp.]
MIETYFALAKGAPGFSSFQRGTIIGARADSDHPSCNFAFISEIPPQDITEILDELPNSVYCLPQLEIETIADQLQRNGFMRGGDLEFMYLVNPSPESNLDLRSVTGYLNRFELTETLARLFFPKQEPHFGQVLASLVAEASDCLLLSYEEANTFIGGAMLHTVGGTTGLYNIAIKESKRHRGHGKRLVNNLLSIALQRTKVVTLQCAPALVPWYESLGFRRYGTMLTFSKISL